MTIFIQNHLKYYRERQAVSQQKLALLSGIHKITISRIERNTTKLPCHTTRQKLADALQVGVHRIFLARRLKSTAIV